MKIAYLHGLESQICEQDPKIQFLRTEFDTAYTPSIDYTDPTTFETLLTAIRELQPGLIVGSSMGGYLGYLIGSALGIPTLLFNPAVVHRSFNPVVHATPTKPTHHTLYLGDLDTTIPGHLIREWFALNSQQPPLIHSYPDGHRVPQTQFIQSIAKWKQDHHSFPKTL
jgi:hypothetical protein